jgi:UDP-glucose 4-epimerase
MPRAVLTGAAGFIGSHLSETLLDRGWSVVGIDNLLTGSVDNIAHLAGRDFMFVKHDVTNYIYVDGPVDVVFHWASPASPIDYLELPIPTLKVGALGTHKALGLAKAKQARFVIASTSEVYGKSADVPFREDADLVLGPTSKHRWAYACSKMIDEFLALAYWKERKLPVIVVRLFNTVGPRQTGQYGMVIPNFVRQALAGQPITVFGDGTQSRSFTYVGDVVRAMVALIDEPRAVGQVFNIGNGHEITIRQLADKVKQLTGSSSEIVTVPYERAYEAGFEDMPRRVPDIGRIQALVGYRPTVDLDETLTRVIEHFRQL